MLKGRGLATPFAGTCCKALPSSAPQDQTARAGNLPDAVLDCTDHAGSTLDTVQESRYAGGFEIPRKGDIFQSFEGVMEVLRPHRY